MPRMGTGSPNATIMVVGEFFSPEDERKGQPFSDYSADEFTRMLHEAGIMASECYFTNVVNARPKNGDIGEWIAGKKKDRTLAHQEFMGAFVRPVIVEGVARLRQEIALVQPNIIIALGNLALWALTGAKGVTKWRGSQLHTSDGIKCIPTLPPGMVNRQWELRSAVVNDLKRVARERNNTGDYANKPNWRFIVRPSAQTVLDTLNMLLGEASRSPSPLWIDFDLETRAGHIACAGISWSLEDAICIPLMCVENKDGYWHVDEEAGIIHILYRLLTHPNVNVRGQNLLYDAQYTYRHWHFVPRVAQDTMLSHHVLFAGLPKRLDYQASLYCDHYVYWKDDGKTWTKDVGEDQLWVYNCIDCVRTREVGEVESQAIQTLGLQGPDSSQQSMFWPVLRAMQLGVRIDLKRRNQLAMELQEELARRDQFFMDVLGHPLNPRSPTQMAKLFYTDLGLPPIMSRAKKGVPAHVTCDEEALTKLRSKEPLIAPLIDMILQYRQIGVFLSTFVSMPLDQDQRMRCSYNLAGTETFRLSSSENAFGSGGNLQNIPKGDEA